MPGCPATSKPGRSPQVPELEVHTQLILNMLDSILSLSRQMPNLVAIELNLGDPASGDNQLELRNVVFDFLGLSCFLASGSAAAHGHQPSG